MKSEEYKKAYKAGQDSMRLSEKELEDIIFFKVPALFSDDVAQKIARNSAKAIISKLGASDK